MKAAFTTAAVLLLQALALAPLAAAERCGELANGYGPFDYRTDRDKLAIVEQHHFTSKVETLKEGQSSYLGDDINYVLLAFPNHPRALAAMGRLAVREKIAQPQGAKYTMDCYFDRAIRFRPDDLTVRLLAGAYYGAAGRKKDAVTQLETAAKMGAAGADFDYNLGMAYFEAGDHDRALDYAHRALKGGYNLIGLKTRLVNAGKWREPSATQPAPGQAGKR